MPSGAVSMLELGEAIVAQIEAEVAYLDGKVKIIDPKDEDEIEQFRKGMGTDNHAVRVVEAGVQGTSAFGSTMEWEFLFRVTVVFRKAGNMEVRPEEASDGYDITQTVKSVISALQGERLNLLNTTGLECGAATWVVREGSALQAMRFQITGRSRERRS